MDIAVLEIFTEMKLHSGVVLSMLCPGELKTFSCLGITWGLKGGTISHGTALARAMEICRETRGECNWPQIPEECWQQAIEELLTIEE